MKDECPFRMTALYLRLHRYMTGAHPGGFTYSHCRTTVGISLHLQKPTCSKSEQGYQVAKGSEPSLAQAGAWATKFCVR